MEQDMDGGGSAPWEEPNHQELAVSAIMRKKGFTQGGPPRGLKRSATGGALGPQAKFKKEEASGCKSCGRSAHNEGRECPAKGKKCYQCGKTGHFKERCMMKTATNSVEAEGSGDSKQTNAQVN